MGIYKTNVGLHKKDTKAKKYKINRISDTSTKTTST